MTPLDRASILIATGFGLGRSPWAPGTVGTLLGVPLALAIWTLPGLALQAALVTVSLLAAVGVAGRAAHALESEDPPCVVVDEYTAFPLAVLGLPHDTWTLVAAFVLFRALDIWKPGPIGRLQALPGGWGIVADDVAAAIVANIVLRAGTALIAQ